MSEKTANTKATPVNEDEELVEYCAPMLGMDKPQDVLCAVNGETIRIKRGETVKIKRKFVKALQNAAEQERAAWKTIQKAQKDAERPYLDL